MKTKVSLKYFVSYCSPVNSGSVLTGRIHTKIMRLGDGCLNRETPNKSGRLGRYVKIFFNLPFAFEE